MKKYLKKYWPSIISFIIPFLIMLTYFAYRHMSPFGHNSILTVDLGQQYIDFFAYFKRTLLHNFNNIIYSFSNALGSNMIGSFAYYLMSPLNIIILFFPLKYITSGVLLILLLKYGLSGLTMSILLYQNNISNKWIPIWSIIYALNGWIIANQLNIMWIDEMILLPIVILGVNKIINKEDSRLYIIGLTCTIIFNYYIGYMICIFTLLYIIYNLYIFFNTFNEFKKRCIKFIKATLISFLLSSWIILPTWYSITQSKGQYTNLNIKWKFEYNPINIISKFFNGSFNFNQMPKGYPNIFVGSITIIAFLAYFFNSKIILKKRIASMILTLILLISMFLSPLDLFWHAMQYPIWYPYRFSFIFCFWMIWIAANSFNKGMLEHINKIKIFFPTVSIITLGIIYILFNNKKFNFLSLNNIIIGIILMILSLIWSVNINKRIKGTLLILLLISISEMSLNVFNSLNNISYVSNDDYINYTQMLRKHVNNIKNSDHSFYRLSKTFYRTKDDPLEVGYNGGDNFSSTLEKNTPTFMENIGQPDGDGFIEYSNGTLFSDSLLSMKYLLHQNYNNNSSLTPSSPRFDINDYNPINIRNDITTYKNRWALPIIFNGSKNIFETNDANNPIQYQNNIFNKLINDKFGKLFTPCNFDSASFNNINTSNNITGTIFKRKNLLKSANISLTFTPKNNNSYYLTLGNNINNNNSQIYLNNRLVHQYPVYRNTVILNITSHSKNKPINIKVNLLKNSLWMQNFTLYQLHNKNFENGINNLKSNSNNIINYDKDNNFSGLINIKKYQSLITTIPYDKGWHLKINNHKHKINKWDNMFIGAKMHPGKYNIKLYYRPPLLVVGMVISIITLLLLIIKVIIKIKK